MLIYLAQPQRLCGKFAWSGAGNYGGHAIAETNRRARRLSERALFHPLAEVRQRAAKVLAVVDAYKAAKPCVSGLNMFLLLGYDQATEGQRR